MGRDDEVEEGLRVRRRRSLRVQPDPREEQTAEEKVTSAAISFRDESGDEITVRFEKILYLRKPDVLSQTPPERLVGRSALAVVLDDPSGRILWITDEKQIENVIQRYLVWSFE